MQVEQEEEENKAALQIAELQEKIRNTEAILKSHIEDEAKLNEWVFKPSSYTLQLLTGTRIGRYVKEMEKRLEHAMSMIQTYECPGCGIGFVPPTVPEEEDGEGE